jgi:hypothetical protein
VRSAQYTAGARVTAAVPQMFGFRDFVARTHFQLSLMTGSYMVTPWEQALVHTFVITVITVGTYFTAKAAWLGGKTVQDLVIASLGA